MPKRTSNGSAQNNAALAADLPDDLRRRDQAVAPGALPPLDNGEVTEDVSLSPDGGSPDHPIHDEPMEDLQPEDFEAMIDDAERGKIERRVDEETLDLRATQEFAAGSSDPLDQRNPRPIKPK